MHAYCSVLPLFLLALDALQATVQVTSLAKRAERSGGGGRKHRQRTSGPDPSRNEDDGVCEMELSCRTANGQPLQASELKLPIRGPPGPPGPSGPRGDRGEDGANGMPGLPVEEASDVVFDKVVTNLGGAYNVKTGHFTSPVNATYQFNIVVSAQGKQRAAMTIVKNGSVIATVWADSIPYWGSASNVVIVSLDRGEQVWMTFSNRASHFHGYMYTTFSGFLLFEN